MKRNLLAIILLVISGLNTSLFSTPEKDVPHFGSIILFPCAPNPCSDKCLIRTYLPDNDPFSSLRILKADSTLVKEIPLGSETGISSSPLNVTDLQDGNYLYQLFYKGEARNTMSFTVKH